MVDARLKSPEYQRDLVLPAELTASATVIANDNWPHAQAAIDQFMKQLAKEVAGF